MSQQAPVVMGLICTGDSVLARAAQGLLQASGFQVFGVVETAADAIANLSMVAASGQAAPDVIVLDLAACGIAGISVLAQLTEPVQDSPVVVVSPFPALAEAIVEAGAALVVDPSDLRPVLAVLAGIRGVAHAGYPCPCCTPPPPPPPPGRTAAAAPAGTSTVSRPEAIPGLLWNRPGGASGASGGPQTGSSGTRSTGPDDS